MTSSVNDDSVRDPQPGDISVCFFCVNINRFDADLRLQKVTAEEMEGWKDTPVWADLDRARAGIAEVKRRQQAKKDADEKV